MSNVFDKSWEPAETVSDGGISIAHCLSLYFDGTSAVVPKAIKFSRYEHKTKTSEKMSKVFNKSWEPAIISEFL